VYHSKERKIHWNLSSVEDMSGWKRVNLNLDDWLTFSQLHSCGFTVHLVSASAYQLN